MASLTTEHVLTAYCMGAFPMADPASGGEIHWYAPDPRAILPLESFHVSKRLRRTIRQRPFDITINRCFEQVMRMCAEPRDAQGTWISEELVDVYAEMHRQGFAHSVEAWRDEELVGGLYGVAVGALFAGESMFHRATDASKICLFFLVERLRERGFCLLDIQFMTSHLQRFGAIEVSAQEYRRRLHEALSVAATFD